MNAVYLLAGFLLPLSGGVAGKCEEGMTWVVDAAGRGHCEMTHDGASTLVGMLVVFGLLAALGGLSRRG